MSVTFSPTGVDNNWTVEDSVTARHIHHLAGEKDLEALWVVLRPGFLVILFVACWGLNVAVFQRHRIDYFAALGLAKDELASPQRLFSVAALLLGTVLSVFRLLTLSQLPAEDVLKGILVTYLAAFLALYSWLPPPLARLARWRGPLARSLWRCIWPEGGKEVPFIEVLVADGLTSISRSFFDLTLGSCMALTADGSSGLLAAGLTLPWLAGGSDPAQLDPLSIRPRLGDAMEQCQRSPLPFIAWASPFLIRARQCTVSARNAPDGLARNLHLLNLLKYMSAVPIVVFSFCFTRAEDWTPPPPFHLTREDFEALWASAAVLNSAVSFMWDLVMDWGLLQPAPLRTGQFGLRSVLLFRGIWGFYHIAIICNLLGRTLWSLRWSPQATLVLGGFFLSSFQQGAEVFRRSLWSLLRVEWECIRRGVHRSDKHFPV